ncbi:unnamed protein product, partial [Rotaria sp. Silwood2]
ASQIELSTGPSRPIAIIAVDFNNDSLLDIATANHGTESISIFYGYGHGNFSHPMTYSTGYDSLPSSLAAGDFNNDNYVDLAIANYGTNNVGVLFGNSSRTFEKQIIFSTGLGSHPYSIAVGHFNDDGFVDIAIANSGTDEIGVLLNNGNRTYAYQVAYSSNSASPCAIAVVDLNQDNRLEIVITNNGIENIGVLVEYENSHFENRIMYSTGS